jgi:hypothetical protein
MSLSASDFELPPPDISAWRAGNTGTEGVWHFASGQPGRHVMISALVHGNEVCGAWALKGLLEAGVRPRRGSLTLALCNLEAFDSFDPADHDASRFVGRRPEPPMVPDRLDAGGTRERRRAAALRPHVAQADWLLDLHSMHEPSAPLTLTGMQPRNLALARQLRSPEHIVIDAGHKDGVRMRDFGRFGAPDAERPPTRWRCWSNAASTATRPAAPWRRTSARASCARPARSTTRPLPTSCPAGCSPTRRANGRWTSPARWSRAARTSASPRPSPAWR